MGMSVFFFLCLLLRMICLLGSANSKCIEYGKEGAHEPEVDGIRWCAIIYQGPGRDESKDHHGCHGHKHYVFMNQTSTFETNGSYWPAGSILVNPGCVLYQWKNINYEGPFVGFTVSSTQAGYYTSPQNYRFRMREKRKPGEEPRKHSDYGFSSFKCKHWYQ